MCVPTGGGSVRLLYPSAGDVRLLYLEVGDVRVYCTAKCIYRWGASYRGREGGGYSF